MTGNTPANKNEKDVIIMQFNKTIIIGTLHDVDLRESGASMIWVNTGNREDTPVKGAAVPTWFTGIVAIRVPAYVQEKLKEDFYENGMDIIVEGKLQGIRRRIEDEESDFNDFYVVEVQASRLYKERELVEEAE